MENGKNFPPDTIPSIEEEKRETGPPPEASVPVPLTEAQRRFAAQYHALIYGFLLEKKLEMAVVEALARWPEEVVAIGVRHTTVLDRYAAAIREYLPERPLFVVTGSTVTFAKRRALRDVLRDSRNGVLLCTQQSLPSSVNFEFVNKIIIPEMHCNNAGMSQFYMRFVRYTSTEKKDLYFPIYIGSLESNLMQMVLAKEKLTMFMKGQDADMDEIYAKFGVDYDLLSTLMTRETDDEGHLRIHWGEQKIA